MSMAYFQMLERIAALARPAASAGKVADYIPALAQVPADRFGMAVHTVDNEEFVVGDGREAFSIQSVSKVFSLTYAIRLMGDALWERVGREPSGDPFNSLVQLEHEHGLPRNPFINAGAICVADCLLTHCRDAKSALLAFVSGLCGEPIHFDEEVARSEKAWGFRNAALANFMKSFGRLDNDVDAVLDFYFHQCSLRMSCIQLARAFAYLVDGGVCPRTDEQIISAKQARRINALMLTCGTYDAAGEFAFSVGLPCKSGVGGSIIAVAPSRLSVCVWSPPLGPTGNSVAGLVALERFTSATGLSIF